MRRNDKTRRGSRRYGDCRSGYEYQISQARLNQLMTDGKLEHIVDVINYLNQTAGFMRPIIKLTVV